MKGKNEAPQLPDPTLSSVDGGGSKAEDKCIVRVVESVHVYLRLHEPGCKQQGECETNNVLICARANFNHVLAIVQYCREKITNR